MCSFPAFAASVIQQVSTASAATSAAMFCCTSAFATVVFFSAINVQFSCFRCFSYTTSIDSKCSKECSDVLLHICFRYSGFFFCNKCAVFLLSLLQLYNKYRQQVQQRVQRCFAAHLLSLQWFFFLQ